MIISLTAVGPDGRLVRNQLRASGKHGFIVDYTPHVAGKLDSSRFSTVTLSHKFAIKIGLHLAHPYTTPHAIISVQS